MDNPKQHVIDTLKEANNILVTVKNDPTIDQLAACIALTLVLNELGKHGTAVFSGQVPSALEFLEPDKTIEKNTDSLQDFIISLDKAKADKLRYKIEDTVVKIFITPYRTSLSSADLTFEPGDFNVDVVVALGVQNQDDVDAAITEHGRILHDATVLSINIQGGPSEDLGSIAWIDDKASSLSEMIAEVANDLGKEDAIDNQVATALLTGIVAETERFGNAKTTPETMQVAAKLLTAGANQELVATKLSEAEQSDGQAVGIAASEPDGQEGAAGHDGAMPLRDAVQFQDGAGLAEPPAGTADGLVADGSLEIDHPITPLSAFAQENTDFEIPQPQDADPAEGSDAGLPAEEGVPPVIPPGQPPAGTDQGQPASFLQPPLAIEEPAAVSQPAMPAVANPEKSEEEAALSYLKDRHVERHPRAVINPLPGQQPAIEPLHRSNELPELKEGQNPDNIKFDLQPPTLGGTLTANLPSERKAMKLEKEAMQHQAAAPILTHAAPKGEVAPPQAAVASEPGGEESRSPLLGVLPQAPAPTLAELEEQVRKRHATAAVAKPQEYHETAVQTASLITPLIDHAAAPAPAATPSAAGNAAKPNSPPPPAPPPLATPAG